jgi:hypothetical protein
MTLFTCTLAAVAAGTVLATSALAQNANSYARTANEEGKKLDVANASSGAKSARTATDDESIRPFRVKVSNEDLQDLRRRLRATRWPDKETVTDQSQGPRLADLQDLVRYWGDGYD